MGTAPVPSALIHNFCYQGQTYHNIVVATLATAAALTYFLLYVYEFRVEANKARWRSNNVTISVIIAICRKKGSWHGGGAIL